MDFYDDIESQGDADTRGFCKRSQAYFLGPPLDTHEKKKYIIGSILKRTLFVSAIGEDTCSCKKGMKPHFLLGLLSQKS